jgi:hypothetical protein
MQDNLFLIEPVEQKVSTKATARKKKVLEKPVAPDADLSPDIELCEQDSYEKTLIAFLDDQNKELI